MLDVISLFCYFLNTICQFLFCLKQPNQAKQKTHQTTTKSEKPTKKQTTKKPHSPKTLPPPPYLTAD